MRRITLLVVLSGFFIVNGITSAQNPTETVEPNVYLPIATQSMQQISHLATLEGTALWMNDMEFSPNGNFLATVETASPYDGYRDVQGVVRIWDVVLLEEAMTLNTAELSAVSLAFHPEGFYLAVGNTTGEIQLWAWTVPRVDATLTGHDTWVNALSFGSGGGLLLSGSGAVYRSNSAGDSTVRLWLTSSASGPKEFSMLVPENANLGAGLSVAVSPDGGIEAAGMSNDTVRLWGSETSDELAILDGYAWGRDLLFTPDSTQILFAARDGIRVWNVAKAIETFGYIPEYKLIAPLDESEFIFSLALSPDGTVVAAGYQDGTVRLWDMDTGERLIVLEGHTSRVMSLDFNPDGTLLASGGSDGTVRLWGIPAG